MSHCICGSDYVLGRPPSSRWQLVCLQLSSADYSSGACLFVGTFDENRQEGFLPDKPVSNYQYEGGKIYSLGQLFR